MGDYAKRLYVVYGEANWVLANLILNERRVYIRETTDNRFCKFNKQDEINGFGDRL